MSIVIRCLPNRDSYNNKPIRSVIDSIQDRSEHMASFWASARGWAPKEAADLLSSIRPGCFSSLALNLDLTLLAPIKSKGHEAGRLVLAWAHLGSMLECTLQLFLAVWLKSYLADANRIFDKRKPKKPKLRLPQELALENLRVFFDKSIWDDDDKKAWSGWILNIQQRRNAIHALKPRPLGTWPELELAVKQYLAFLEFIDGRLPYPDGEP